ncbi:hypothetical protein [Aestuariimicrobium ganziense]|uniref:hypothetical protein n=1 Tax=Aestuariimicrobium ganziense TaxID=2773677 RepID=UPI001942C5C7|nr:hypothetical protein [Aestuariimicrobium ganziense]
MVGVCDIPVISNVCDSAGEAATVTILADDTTVTVLATTTGEVLSEHDIDPTRAYWRNKNKSPGRWPRL